MGTGIKYSMDTVLTYEWKNMNNFATEELQQIGIRQKNLAAAKQYLSQAIKEMDMGTPEVDILEVFLINDILFFAAHLYRNHKSRPYIIRINNKPTKLMAGEVLVSRAYTKDSLLKLSHSVVTKAIYTAFGEKFVDLLSPSEARMHILRAIIGEDMNDDHAAVYFRDTHC